ncbi:MAG: hypothetical protein JXQ83_15415 [Candidatus Glassbacteria bacterium]|nr:hypothetical protein [Candidatus Glassbacteria bacterium]
MRRLPAIAALTALALAALWAACADRKEPTLVRTHTDEWSLQSSPEFHGRKIEQAGLISCPACHGSDYRGGTSEVSCYRCHNGPGGHPAGFLNPADSSYHGLRVAAGGPAVCAPCHGEDYRGKPNSGVSCYRCHNGPSGHPSTGWLEKTSPFFHGLAASSRGMGECAACHGDDFSGGTSGKSCKLCHPSQSGHPAQGWLEPDAAGFHGERLSQTGQSYCAGCHGSDYRGGDSGVSCYTCHNGPSGHPEGWFDRSSAGYHGLRVAAEGKESCTACHGEDYRGGIAGVSCYACHDGPSGHPEGWFDRSSAGYHGLRVATEGKAFCTPCHGSDYQGGLTGVSCYACHNGPSGHPEGWFERSSDNYHGWRVAAEGKAFCTACHGSDYSGGLAGVSCYACHNGPSGHPQGWFDKNSIYYHGRRVAVNGHSYCAPCHGEDYLGGTVGVSCFTCHDGPGGHPAGWLDAESSAFHAIAAESGGFAACAACHGEDYQGGTSGSSCYQAGCHQEE